MAGTHTLSSSIMRKIIFILRIIHPLFMLVTNLGIWIQIRTQKRTQKMPKRKLLQDNILSKL